jgi:hypothetical protein
VFRELGELARRAALDKSVWRDAEFWLGLCAAAIAGWAGTRPIVVAEVRQHLGDILTVASISFGFMATSFVFFVQATRDARGTKDEANVRRLVLWHALTAVSLVFLLAYTIGWWFLGALSGPLPRSVFDPLAVAGLAFLLVYSGGQILNHVMNLWWYATDL